LRAGHLRLAVQECQEALALMEEIGIHTPAAGYFNYYLAEIFLVQNQLKEAYNSAEQTRLAGQNWQQADLLIIGNVALAKVLLAYGDLIAADQTLLKAEELVQQEQFINHAAPVLAERVRYWLVSGDLDSAANWVQHVVFSPERWDANRKWELLML